MFSFQSIPALAGQGIPVDTHSDQQEQVAGSRDATFQKSISSSSPYLKASLIKATAGLQQTVRTLALQQKQPQQQRSHRRASAADVFQIPFTTYEIELDYAEQTPKLLRRHFATRNELPLSGYEPVFDDRDNRWFDYKQGAETGSYSYALQDYRTDRDAMALPGDVERSRLEAQGVTHDVHPVLTCKDFVKQVLADNPGRIMCVKPGDTCPPKYHKVMAFVDTKNTEQQQSDEEEGAGGAITFLDHHFYVQHKDVKITLGPQDRIVDVAKFFKLPVDYILAANPHIANAPVDQPALEAGISERSVHIPDANVWSHKPDWDALPRLHDGKHRVIRDPRRAFPVYSEDAAEGEEEEGPRERYQLPADYCTSFCVLKGGLHTGSMSAKQLEQQKQQREEA